MSAKHEVKIISLTEANHRLAAERDSLKDTNADLLGVLKVVQDSTPRGGWMSKMIGDAIASADGTPPQVVDSSGAPIPGATLTFCADIAGTPLDIYSDEELTTPCANPAVADAFGQFNKIYLQDLPYTVTLKDADGVPLFRESNVVGTTYAKAKGES